MKKILAILICLIMILSLVACGGDSVTTPSTDSSVDNENSTTQASKDKDETTDNSTVVSSGNGDDTEDSSTQSSKGDDTVDSSTTTSTAKPERPTLEIVPDRTVYKPTVIGDKEAIQYINETLSHPVLTPYYNGYKAALTMTFDDGYDSNTGVIVSDVFEKYDFRGTMMLGPCFLGNDQIIKEWNDIFARGYLDVGCHGYNHEEPTTLDPSKYEHEIYDAIMFLREKFPGQRVLTFATPFAHINGSYEDYMSQFVIGNRLESGGSRVNFGEDLSYNPYRVHAVSFNVNTGPNNAMAEVQNAVKNGRWVVELFHCVKDGASGVDVERSAFVSHCEWLYRNYRDDLWVATFEEVLIYGEQLKHTSIDYTACDRESMTITLTPDGTLDKEIYNIPMTIRVYLPAFVDSAYAMANGKYIPLEMEVVMATGEQFVTVRGIDATEKTDVVIYIGGNKTMTIPMHGQLLSLWLTV